MFVCWRKRWSNSELINFNSEGETCLHHEPLLLDAPGLLGDDVAELGEGGLRGDVVAGDDARVEEGLARGVEPAHAAGDALRRAHDDDAAVGGVPDQRQDVGAVTAVVRILRTLTL